MKLQTFDASNVKSQKKSTPILHINQGGLFSFSKGIIKELGLKDGSQFKLHHDEENPGDWYLEVVDKGGLVLKEKKEIGRLHYNCSSLALEIFKSLNYKESNVGAKLLLGEKVEHDGKELWTMITGHLRK